MTDEDAWNRYPQHRNFFNKLWLSEKLGYSCGPSGVAPKENGFYVIRLIYNLIGMGIGTTFSPIKKDDTTRVPPGYFWSEMFRGSHYSVDYIPKLGKWEEISINEGIYRSNNGGEFSGFEKWKKVKPEKAPTFSLPAFIQELAKDVKTLNIEFIGNKIIEVHLRNSPDPDFSSIIPIFQSDPLKRYFWIDLGYTFLSDYEDGDGFLKDPRIGFCVKNY